MSTLRLVPTVLLSASLLVGAPAGIHAAALGAAQAASASSPTRYRDVVFTDVEVRENVVFRTARNEKGVDEPLRLDMYLPAGDRERTRPVVVWIHGGGFRPGNDKRQKYIVAMATAFAKRGYVSVAPDYRVREQPGPDRAGALRDAVEDCRAAVRWVEEHASELGIDPARLALAGGSAGGLIGITLTSELVARGTPAAATPVFAFLDLWGDANAALMPAEIDRRFPPTLIVHGTDDQTVPIARSEQFTARLKESGVETTFVRLPGAPHTPLEHLPEIATRAAAFMHNALTKLAR